MQLDSAEAVKRAVSAGLGISLVLAASVRQEILHGALAIVPVEGLRFCKNILLVQREHALIDSSARKFADFIWTA